MDLLSDIRKKASERGKHIVLPEGSDERMIKAAERLHRERICKVTLLDPEKNVIEKAKELGVCLDGIEVLNAQDSNKVDKYAEDFFEIRKHKGITREVARETILNPLFWGAMMVREDDADGSVAGAVNTTGNVLRAGIQCIGLAENISIVSSIFLMIVPGWEKPFTFTDCAAVPEPNPDQLASIAISSART
ncbi:MAG: phosphate acetyltransferase, partial [Candidatus Neomarinimicrobiota bacterium]